MLRTTIMVAAFRRRTSGAGSRVYLLEEVSNLRTIAVFLFLIFIVPNSYAQAPAAPGLTPDALANSLLRDVNGDGQIVIVAFGDSITRGTGDFLGPDEEVERAEEPEGEAGYPLRLERYFGLSVLNRGDPGESVFGGGFERYISTLNSVRPDLVLFSEGANDTVRGFVDRTRYGKTVQTLINVTRSRGIDIVLGTILKPCCNHESQAFSIATLTEEVRRLALINDLPFWDTEHAYNNTCTYPECRLLVRPDGLHPNIDGYDVMAEAVMATLLQIDLYAPDGPTQLETALNLPVGSVKTRPDPVPAS
jgi:lysophospholipase L1-like esterase